MLCSLEDVKFSNICLKMFEGIQPFKCDMLRKCVDKTPNCANLVLYFSKKVQHILVFCFAFFSATKESLGNGFSVPYDHKCLRYLAACLKI